VYNKPRTAALSVPHRQHSLACLAAHYGGEGPVQNATTVLVIEDNSAVRQTVRFVLEVKGYHVLEAPDGLITTPGRVLYTEA
jgi:hypothetical protein